MMPNEIKTDDTSLINRRNEDYYRSIAVMDPDGSLRIANNTERNLAKILYMIPIEDRILSREELHIFKSILSEQHKRLRRPELLTTIHCHSYFLTLIYSASHPLEAGGVPPAKYFAIPQRFSIELFQQIKTFLRTLGNYIESEHISNSPSAANGEILQFIDNNIEIINTRNFNSTTLAERFFHNFRPIDEIDPLKKLSTTENSGKDPKDKSKIEHKVVVSLGGIELDKRGGQKRSRAELPHPELPANHPKNRTTAQLKSDIDRTISSDFEAVVKSMITEDGIPLPKRAAIELALRDFIQKYRTPRNDQ